MTILKNSTSNSKINTNKKTLEIKVNNLIINYDGMPKNRKICSNICKNDDILVKKAQYMKPEVTNKLIELAYQTDLITYIKMLLEAYKSLPTIIGIVDRLIENKASLISTSSIYGNSYLATYKDVDKIIDMTQRKDKLLNIFFIVDTMLDSLSDQDRKIAVLKFVQRNTAEDIAKEIKSTSRTVFRKASRIVEKLAVFCLNNNWTSAFIKTQIGNEPWLDDIYKKKKSEERSNMAKNKIKIRTITSPRRQ